MTARKKAKTAPFVATSAVVRPPDETRVTAFDGMKPTPDENRDKMREYFELLMKRGAVSMVITAEFANGDAATSAVGPPAGLETLARLGLVQVIDMLSRPSGENG